MTPPNKNREEAERLVDKATGEDEISYAVVDAFTTALDGKDKEIETLKVANHSSNLLIAEGADEAQAIVAEKDLEIERLKDLIILQESTMRNMNISFWENSVLLRKVVGWMVKNAPCNCPLEADESSVKCERCTLLSLPELQTYKEGA